MKKILFLHSSAELYGSDRSLLNIITNIDKNEFEIHVMLPCDGPLVPLLSQIPNVTVSIFDFAVLRRKMLSIGGGISYVISFLKSKRHIKKYIKENKIDVVYTNTSVIFPGAIAAKASKIKSVWHVREIIKSNTENKVVSAIIKRYADVVIANSKETANALLVPQEKIRVIYNAVSEKEDSQIKEHSPLTVGMAGRINRWKGQKLFVDAAEIVHKKIPDAVFKIAGAAYTGEEFLEEELKQYIKEKGLTDTVKLCGHISDMDEFYSCLDVFVLPSTQPEPFGLVVIEAMEYSLPVIATNHGGPTEIITDGTDGYLVSHLDATQMADRLICLLENEEQRKEMGCSAKAKKRTMFSIGKMVLDIENLLKEFLN